MNTLEISTGRPQKVVTSIRETPVLLCPAWFPKRQCPVKMELLYTTLGTLTWRSLTLLGLSYMQLTTCSSFLDLFCYSLTTSCKNGVCTLEFFASSGSGHAWQLPVSRGKIIFLNSIYAKMIQNGLWGQVCKLWFHMWHCINDLMWF